MTEARKIKFADQVLEELKQRFPEEYRETTEGLFFPTSMGDRVLEAIDTIYDGFEGAYEVGNEQQVVMPFYGETEFGVIRTGLTPTDKTVSMLDLIRNTEEE